MEKYVLQQRYKSAWLDEETYDTRKEAEFGKLQYVHANSGRSKLRIVKREVKS